MKSSGHPVPSSQLPAKSGSANLLRDVRELILVAREQVARTVNAGLVLLYWQIGQRIRKDILREKRAAYGEQILSALETQGAPAPCLDRGNSFRHQPSRHAPDAHAPSQDER